MTATIVIGNSDNKLTQQEWSEFCGSTGQFISIAAKHIHFSGHSIPHMPWQNAAWVIEIDELDAKGLKLALGIMARNFRQDSIAWVQAEPEFIRAA